MLYQLAINPGIQQKLYDSLRASNFDYESICTNEYLDAVVSETLRMYPPLGILSREANEDYTLPETNITITKGMNIAIPVHSIHYDPENVESPDVFMPERFLSENRHKIKPYTYLPFGAGPRICIGMRFALLEAKLLIMKLVLKFRFSKCPKTDVPPKYKKMAGFLAFDPLYVAVEPR